MPGGPEAVAFAHARRSLPDGHVPPGDPCCARPVPRDAGDAPAARRHRSAAADPGRSGRLVRRGRAAHDDPGAAHGPVRADRTVGQRADRAAQRHRAVHARDRRVRPAPAGPAGRCRDPADDRGDRRRHGHRRSGAADRRQAACFSRTGSRHGRVRGRDRRRFAHRGSGRDPAGRRVRWVAATLVVFAFAGLVSLGCWLAFIPAGSARRPRHRASTQPALEKQHGMDARRGVRHPVAAVLLGDLVAARGLRGARLVRGGRRQPGRRPACRRARCGDRASVLRRPRGTRRTQLVSVAA